MTAARRRWRARAAGRGARSGGVRFAWGPTFYAMGRGFRKGNGPAPAKRPRSPDHDPHAVGPPHGIPRLDAERGVELGDVGARSVDAQELGRVHVGHDLLGQRLGTPLAEPGERVAEEIALVGGQAVDLLPLL